MTKYSVINMPLTNPATDDTAVPNGQPNNLCESATSCLDQAAEAVGTAVKWAGYWMGAGAINSGVSAIPGMFLGGMIRYGHERMHSCIGEINSVAVGKCAMKFIPEGIAYGAVIGAGMGLALTGIGFLRDPSIKGARKTTTWALIGAGGLCYALASGLGGD